MKIYTKQIVQCKTNIGTYGTQISVSISICEFWSEFVEEYSIHHSCTNTVLRNPWPLRHSQHWRRYWKDAKGNNVRRNARKKIHFSKCFSFYIFLYGFHISVRNISSSSLIFPSKKVQLVEAAGRETQSETDDARKEKRAGVEWSRRFVGLHKNLWAPHGGWL